MDRLYIALAALAGGLAAAFAGWLESHEPFNWRKFASSALRALVAGAVFAAGYELSGMVGILDLFYAFLGGAGVDVLGNRIASKLGNGSFPLPNNSTQAENPTPDKKDA
jgi:hypothetical protein